MVSKGDRIGDYVIVDMIGNGGFGSVYKAEDFSKKEIVAIKVLHSQLVAEHDHEQFFSVIRQSKGTWLYKMEENHSDATNKKTACKNLLHQQP